MIPSIHSIVKVDGKHGLVMNRYVNGDETNPILEVQLAEGIFNQCGTVLFHFNEKTVEPSTEAELHRELNMLFLEQNARWNEFATEAHNYALDKKS